MNLKYGTIKEHWKRLAIEIQTNTFWNKLRHIRFICDEGNNSCKDGTIKEHWKRLALDLPNLI